MEHTVEDELVREMKIFGLNFNVSQGIDDSSMYETKDPNLLLFSKKKFDSFYQNQRYGKLLGYIKPYLENLEFPELMLETTFKFQELDLIRSLLNDDMNRVTKIMSKVGRKSIPQYCKLVEYIPLQPNPENRKDYDQEKRKLENIFREKKKESDIFLNKNVLPYIKQIYSTPPSLDRKRLALIIRKTVSGNYKAGQHMTPIFHLNKNLNAPNLSRIRSEIKRSFPPPPPPPPPKTTPNMKHQRHDRDEQKSRRRRMGPVRPVLPLSITKASPKYSDKRITGLVPGSSNKKKIRNINKHLGINKPPPLARKSNPKNLLVAKPPPPQKILSIPKKVQMSYDQMMSLGFGVPNPQGSSLGKRERNPILPPIQTIPQPALKRRKVAPNPIPIPLPGIQLPNRSLALAKRIVATSKPSPNPPDTTEYLSRYCVLPPFDQEEERSAPVYFFPHEFMRERDGHKIVIDQGIISRVVYYRNVPSINDGVLIIRNILQRKSLGEKSIKRAFYCQHKRFLFVKFNLFSFAREAVQHAGSIIPREGILCHFSKRSVVMSPSISFEYERSRVKGIFDKLKEQAFWGPTGLSQTFGEPVMQFAPPKVSEETVEKPVYKRVISFDIIRFSKFVPNWEDIVFCLVDKMYEGAENEKFPLSSVQIGITDRVGWRKVKKCFGVRIENIYRPGSKTVKLEDITIRQIRKYVKSCFGEIARIKRFHHLSMAGHTVFVDFFSFFAAFEFVMMSNKFIKELNVVLKITPEFLTSDLVRAAKFRL